MTAALSIGVALAGCGEREGGERAQAPGVSALVPGRCDAADLEVRSGFQGATQSIIGGVVVHRADGAACHLSRHPRVSLIDPAGRTLDVTQEPDPRAGGLSPLIIRPRERKRRSTAVLTVQWANWCGPLEGGRPRVRVAFPGSGEPVIVPISMRLRTGYPNCRTEGFEGPKESVVRVAFERAHYDRFVAP